MVYKEAVLDLCLPVQMKALRRQRARLTLLLTGDLRSNDIDYFSEEEAPDLDKYSKDLVAALLPHAVKVFARHRWLTSLASLQATLLIALCHNIFNRAVVIWLS
eukprot:4110423-Lingulodinium_polyedra.AAC.1